MSDNNAARKGDEIIHSSIFADITSIVAEGAAYAVIGAAVGLAATAAAPLLGAGAAAAGVAAIGSSCLLSGIVGGVLANLAGVTDDISNIARRIRKSPKSFKTKRPDRFGGPGAWYRQ